MCQHKKKIAFAFALVVLCLQCQNLLNKLRKARRRTRTHVHTYTHARTHLVFAFTYTLRKALGKYQIRTASNDSVPDRNSPHTTKICCVRPIMRPIANNVARSRIEHTHTHNRNVSIWGPQKNTHATCATRDQSDAVVNDARFRRRRDSACV